MIIIESNLRKTWIDWMCYKQIVIDYAKIKSSISWEKSENKKIVENVLRLAETEELIPKYIWTFRRRGINI